MLNDTIKMNLQLFAEPEPAPVLQVPEIKQTLAHRKLKAHYSIVSNSGIPWAISLTPES